MKLHLKGGRLIDPTSGKDESFDILVVDGRIEKLGKDLSADKTFEVVKLKGKIVAPGFIDMHAPA